MRGSRSARSFAPPLPREAQERNAIAMLASRQHADSEQDGQQKTWEAEMQQPRQRKQQQQQQEQLQRPPFAACATFAKPTADCREHTAHPALMQVDTADVAAGAPRPLVADGA